MRKFSAKQLINKKRPILRHCLWIVLGLIFFVNSPSPALSQENAHSDILEVTAAVPRNFPPAYSVDKNGRPSGFAIELTERIASLTGLKVAYLVKNSWPEVSKTLRSGQADFIPEMGITARRKKLYDFTAPFRTFSVSIFVRKDTYNIRGIDDLYGRKVGVVKNNIAVKLLKDRGSIDIRVYPQVSGILFELLSGHVDAVVYPETVFKKLARDAGIANYIKTVGKPLTEIKRAMAVSKGNTELLKRLDDAVKSFIRTKEYQQLYTKWFGKTQPFWTVKKTALVMSGFLLIMFTGMGIWRYFSVLKINRRLSVSIKGRKKAEKALRLTDFLLNHAGEATFLADSDEQLVYVNQEACRSLGYSKEELLSMTVSDLDPNVTAEKWKEHWNEFKQQDSVTFESHHRTKNGKVFPVEITVNYLDFEGREFICGFVRNIAARKQAEEKLCERTRLNQILLDAFPCVALLLKSNCEVVVLTRPDGTPVLFPEKNALELLDREMTGAPGALRPKYWQQVRPSISRLRRSESSGMLTGFR